jgi:hypothetical protein
MFCIIGIWRNIAAVLSAVSTIHGEKRLARSVWALAPAEIEDFVLNLLEPNAKAWLAAVIEAMSRDEMTRVAVTLWALWHARKKIIHEGIYQPPPSTNMFVERFMSCLEVLAPEPAAAVPKWIPPPAGWAKVNVDAA